MENRDLHWNMEQWEEFLETLLNIPEVYDGGNCDTPTKVLTSVA